MYVRKFDNTGPWAKWVSIKYETKFSVEQQLTNFVNGIR